MNFGQAIDALKAGKKVRRSGWNGKGMFLSLCDGEIARDGNPSDPFIVMWTAQKTWQPGWLASQADMLGEDWELAG